MRGRGGRHEAGLGNERTAIRQGEEEGAGTDWRRVDGLTEEKQWGGQTNSDGEEETPVTREAGPGTPMGSQGTRAEDTAMVTLAAEVLEDGGTPSDTPEKQHGIPPLPLGGGGDLVRH